MTDPASGPADQTSPESITDLILRVFRVNGALLAAGDRLVGVLGLTSARWQLLGAIANQEERLSVAQLARAMSVTRQAVQRIVNELQTEGVVAFCSNPRHKRAQLVELTAQGRTLFEKAMTLQRPWAVELGRGLSKVQVSEACETLDMLLATVNESMGDNPEKRFLVETGERR